MIRAEKNYNKAVELLEDYWEKAAQMEKNKEENKKESNIQKEYDNYMETNENKYLPVLHCLENSWGWEIDENLDIDAPHIQKYTFGCYELPEILLHLAESCDAKIEQIELCGFCTDICVISNALILKSVFAPMDIDIVVDAHACAGVTPEKHAAALEVMKSCQIIVKE